MLEKEVFWEDWICNAIAVVLQVTQKQYSRKSLKVVTTQ